MTNCQSYFPRFAILSFYIFARFYLIGQNVRPVQGADDIVTGIRLAGLTHTPLPVAAAPDTDLFLIGRPP
jgi:hypothetical protein